MRVECADSVAAGINAYIVDLRLIIVGTSVGIDLVCFIVAQHRMAESSTNDR